MYDDIYQFEPLYPSQTGELEDIARELVAVSSRLEGRLPDVVLADIKELLRVVNSYYSNLIEGHSTHPFDIERAMNLDYSKDSEVQDLQIESRIHIEVQKKITEKLKNKGEESELIFDKSITSKDFLCWIHGEFYEKMPDRLRWAKGKEGKKAWVKAGKLRTNQVVVGKHIPPIAKSLTNFLKRFDEFYNPEKLHGLRPIIALSAAHHRLMWIHPFLDGNGRVARLLTDAYFERIGLSGYSLWNVSRGLSRRRDEYRSFLAAADFAREGDLDGRGNLSNRTLTQFCKFFLEVCLDQAEFMNGLLKLNEFLDRIESYVTLRNGGLIVDEKGKKLSSLHPLSGRLLREIAIRGEIPRGEVSSIINKSERTGRNLLKDLLDEDLIKTRSEKGLLRLGFPTHAASYFFPDLYPRIK